VNLRLPGDDRSGGGKRINNGHGSIAIVSGVIFAMSLFSYMSTEKKYNWANEI
jgi:hypothetical protein